MTTQEQFFYDNGAYSWDPQKETEAAGRMRCAIEMARAENHARDNGWHITVEESGEEFSWQGNCFDVITTRNYKGERFTGYDVTLYDEDGADIGSLGGVTFKDNNPHEPYRRVIAAELALEAMPPRVPQH